MKVQAVSLARIVNETEQTYLDVPVTLDAQKKALFKGLVCDDCELPLLTDSTSAPDLKSHIDTELDLTGLTKDTKEDQAKAILHTENLGDAAVAGTALVQDSEKTYDVDNSIVMLGAGLALKAGTMTFTSAQGFEAGKWQAPITVVVSDL